MSHFDPIAPLAEFALTAVPTPDALDVMRLSVFDWAACGIAGRDEPVSALVRDLAAEDGGTPEASVIGLDAKLPARAAAQVNGTTSHALDYDDTHFAHIGHPSVVVVPAALAVAEGLGASSEAFLQAALIGAEASIRMGLWLGRGHYQVGFHQTATAGVFGAAVAAARLLQADADQMHHALALASTRAAGLKSQFGSMGKPYNAGFAAAGGVEAALLATRGFRSAPDVVFGPEGFSTTHHGQSDGTAFLDLGEYWLMETVSHKYHACCHGLHAVLECVAALDDDVDLDTIERIEVTTHPRWLSVCNQEAPTTGLGAKFSFSTVVAMALLGYDTAMPQSFSHETCVNPEVQSLRKLVVVAGDVGLAETESELRLCMPDTTSLLATHDIAVQLPYAARAERLKAKAESLLGPIAAPVLAQAVFDADGPDLAALGVMLRQPSLE